MDLLALIRSWHAEGTRSTLRTKTINFWRRNDGSIGYHRRNSIFSQKKNKAIICQPLYDWWETNLPDQVWCKSDWFKSVAWRYLAGSVVPCYMLTNYTSTRAALSSTMGLTMTMLWITVNLFIITVLLDLLNLIFILREKEDWQNSQLCLL